jgi:hypothetical protein
MAARYAPAFYSGLHQLVQQFFTAIARGERPDDLVTADMTFRSVNSAASDRRASTVG